eukprot:GFYU01006869.1.p1 GENE.GFYU01006869.1~~GFYU01006869.1.p1  ORF type:complete len:434 (-),score=118.50 GFYU01006869.1:97-1398(-)
MPPPNAPGAKPKRAAPVVPRGPLALKGKEKEEDVLMIEGAHAVPSGPGVGLDSTTDIGRGLSAEQQAEIRTSLNPSNTEVENNKVSAITEVHVSNKLVTRKTIKIDQPEWHAPWKLMRVITGHFGAVRCAAVDPSNEWFATGSADRTIKIWDLASGTLKLTLTGHIHTLRGLAVSQRHPYLFSVSEDKTVKCWDLEHNKVIRSYHGHLSGVYTAALHPTLDVLVTGGRDSSVRVWDIRTKAAAYVFTGHQSTVGTIQCQATEPQIISGSHDTTVKCWDLIKGKCSATLTHHKKSIRSVAVHPTDYAFASGGGDKIKKWKCPEPTFMQNYTGHNSMINSLVINRDNVMVSGGDNGSMYFWDWKTGYNFQRLDTIVQPGSLDSEAGIYGMAFDMTGTRLITCEADKTVKVYKEDPEATPETHPIDFKGEINPSKY